MTDPLVTLRIERCTDTTSLYDVERLYAKTTVWAARIRFTYGYLTPEVLRGHLTLDELAKLRGEANRILSRPVTEVTL